MKYFVSLFLSLFFLVFMSCGNEDNAWDNNIPIITPNEQSDSSGLLKSQITDIINYSKINFDENFNNTELYKNLILSPKWENVSMVLQKQDTLHLCVPLLAQDNPEHNSYYLFISNIKSANIIRFTIIGLPENFWDIINAPITRAGIIDAGWIPEVTILGDLCRQMSHICSDPYDEAFLEFLHSKWLKEHGNESSSDSSSSGGDYSRLTEAEKRFLMRHPQVIKKFHDNARKASEAAKKFPGQHNGEGDAVRHVYWSALNTLSENANLAKEFGDAHEQNPGQDIAEKNMDLFNNSIGYLLGDLAKQNKWSEERLFKEIIKYKNDGKLQTKLHP